jgi:hypothetical protein
VLGDLAVVDASVRPDWRRRRWPYCTVRYPDRDAVIEYVPAETPVMSNVPSAPVTALGGFSTAPPFIVTRTR